MQPRGSFSYEEILSAYYGCRRNKRSTANALEFEIDYESKLLDLLDEINAGQYRPGPSITFIVDKPVKREIFAADFRDRIVHHLLIAKINTLLEREFIYDSYACREAKGALMGVKRVARFIRSCSEGYTKDCYILKLDIRGFFMHIDKRILWHRLKVFLLKNYTDDDKDLLLRLAYVVLDNNPCDNCIVKGSRSNWKGLPRDKSLFYAKPNVGLPIGNLTSQVLANFYMSRFDHYMKHDIGLRYYGRYVDDFVVVHPDMAYLRALIPTIRVFLDDELHLELHPNKIYLQHYSKVVQFLGTIIKPGRVYSAKRLKANFWQAIAIESELARDHKPGEDEQEAFLARMNSYLGLLRHFDTYRLRKRLVYRNLSSWWWNCVSLDCDASRFYLRHRRCKRRL